MPGNLGGIRHEASGLTHPLDVMGLVPGGRESRRLLQEVI